MSPSTLSLKRIRLRVKNLARSVGFYRDQMGFVETACGSGAALAVEPGAEPILFLEEAASAPAALPSAAGLFHAALLLPRPEALGRWIVHAAERHTEFDGFSDHGVSEAVYLSDPDGNGLEFYCDRPRSQWPRHEGTLAMVTAPLDLDALIAKASPATPTPLSGAVWGHLHLRVTHLERSERFYGPALGMEVTQASFPGARFMAADGYHHHLGLNVWGRPTAPRSADALGLVEADFAKSGAAGGLLSDPDGIAIRLSAG